MKNGLICSGRTLGNIKTSHFIILKHPTFTCTLHFLHQPQRAIPLPFVVIPYRTTDSLRQLTSQITRNHGPSEQAQRHLALCEWPPAFRARRTRTCLRIPPDRRFRRGPAVWSYCGQLEEQRQGEHLRERRCCHGWQQACQRRCSHRLPGTSNASNGNA
jgi:hypothetical protein